MGNAVGVNITTHDDAGDDSNHRSPFRAKWLVPLIYDTIAEAPMASNQMLKAILSPYGKEYAVKNML